MDDKQNQSGSNQPHPLAPTKRDALIALISVFLTTLVDQIHNIARLFGG